MSGAPIIQNGKFIGAVTHVLVSDPTQGYAVFGDLMIKQSRETKKWNKTGKLVSFHFFGEDLNYTLNN